jgi:hypothetical protein
MRDSDAPLDGSQIEEYKLICGLDDTLHVSSIYSASYLRK